MNIGIITVKVRLRWFLEHITKFIESPRYPSGLFFYVWTKNQDFYYAKILFTKSSVLDRVIKTWNWIDWEVQAWFYDM